MYGSEQGKLHGINNVGDLHHTINMKKEEQIISVFGTAFWSWGVSAGDQIGSIKFGTNQGRLFGPWGNLSRSSLTKTSFEFPRNNKIGYLGCLASRAVLFGGGLNGLRFTFDVEC